MPFPESPKVYFKKNPIDTVICQLKFPTILKIDTEIPSDFQELIRGDYPILGETSEQVFPVTQEGEKHIPPQIIQNLNMIKNTNYEFFTADKIWKINLTKDFLALSTKKYIRWSEFCERLKIPCQALIDIYKPAFFARVGLRYIDIIKRSKLGLTDTPWHKLIIPPISGVLSSLDIYEHTKSIENKYEIKLENNTSQVRIMTRLVEAADDGEECFMIDSDFSTSERTELKDAFEVLDYFNIRGARLIRWCLSDKLKDAMEPETL